MVWAEVQRVVGTFGEGAKTWPVAPEIEMSILELGYTIGNAATDIYDIPCKAIDIPAWSRCALLEKRLLEVGWCPMDVFRMMEDMTIDGHYYISSSQARLRGVNHQSCTDAGCVAKTVNESQYETKHLTNGCDCPTFEPSTNHVIRIIGREGIPIMCWGRPRRSGEYRLKVGEYNKTHHRKLRYVAISHVWPDGLGNPKTNALPKCQLDRIQ
ncbi:hypothetical protein K440DRAFT_627087 [Wilcoxina mikolae CBS 423.85]|nr:hypothetical protein K440DRAFT_627087 [Wilcoxina mikolae CBS 423.85]